MGLNLIPTPPKLSEVGKPAIPVPAASQSDEDPSFEITIIGPKNEPAQFKTRGKHPVRKVLAAACKTFGIKYERCVVSIILFCLSLGLPFHCNSASPLFSFIHVISRIKRSLSIHQFIIFKTYKSSSSLASYSLYRLYFHRSWFPFPIKDGRLADLSDHTPSNT